MIIGVAVPIGFQTPRILTMSSSGLTVKGFGGGSYIAAPQRLLAIRTGSLLVHGKALPVRANSIIEESHSKGRHPWLLISAKTHS